MEPNNLVQLIWLLEEYEDLEPDPRLNDGEVLAADGTVVKL